MNMHYLAHKKGLTGANPCTVVFNTKTMAASKVKRTKNVVIGNFARLGAELAENLTLREFRNREPWQAYAVRAQTDSGPTITDPSPALFRD